jgi:regulator of protease activity HflC (stomatin/prohibitin superfamily)
MEEYRNKFICGGIAAVIIIPITLIISSYDSLEPREIGLVYNHVSKSIDTENFYEGGRHFIGLFSSFIPFPGYYQTLEFSDEPSSQNDPLIARTNDGVSIKLSLSFQYQIEKDYLNRLYDLTNVNYNANYLNIARDTILQTVATYGAKQFWSNRQNISDTMKDNLDHALAAAYARCVGLQLLKVSIPNNLEEAIIETQVETQLATTKFYERQGELIRQNINISYSLCNQNITSVTAEANAQAYYIIEYAKANAIQNFLEIYSDVYNKTRNDLELLDDEFIEYLYLRAAQDQPNATIVMGVTDSVIQVS